MIVQEHIWYGIGTEIGVALGICLVARDKALQLQDNYNNNVLPGEKKRTDKWTHAYVGCALRQGFISPSVARMMAEGKEILDAIEDFFTGDADSTSEDSAATMLGYWSAYEGAQIEKKHIGCGIYTYVYINVQPCERICDILYDIPPIIKAVIVSPPEWIKPPEFDENLLTVMNENQELIIKTAAQEVAKTDKEKANQISENRNIESQPTKKAREMTKELKKVNTEIYKLRAKDLRENGIKGIKVVEFLLNSNKKEIHNLRKITPLCNLNLIKRDHSLYVRNKKYAIRAMAQGYDGCKHCMTKFHIK